MTAPVRHPDPEQLAAFAAGEPEVLDPLIIQAHLDVCSVCAADVRALDELDAELAAMAEPELPAGLAQRLTTAVRAENAALPPAAPPAAAAFGQADHSQTGGPRTGTSQGGADRDSGGLAAPVTPLRPRSARRPNLGRLLWVAAAALVLLAVVFVGQLEGLSPSANDSRAGPEPPPPTQESDTEGPAAGQPATPPSDRTTPSQGGTDGQQQPETLQEPRGGPDAPAAEQAPGAPAQPGTGPPATTQPPSARQDDQRHEVVPDVAPRSAPADEGEGDGGGDQPPPVETSPGREDPSEDNVTPPAPADPSINQVDECEAAVRENDHKVVEVRESEGKNQPTVIIAEDPDTGRRFEYTFPGGDCTQPVTPRPTNAP